VENPEPTPLERKPTYAIMSRRKIIASTAVAGSPLATTMVAQDTVVAPPKSVYNVRDFGAKGDGVSKDTGAIQTAIDTCHRAGGGTVLLPTGTFLAGTIRLKSNVDLHLSSGALLQASSDRQDYVRVHPQEEYLPNSAPMRGAPYHFTLDYHLLVAQEAENVTISGTGTLFGNGRAWMGALEFKSGQEKFNIKGGWRPGPLVAFDRCKRVKLLNVTLKESAMFHAFFIGCDTLLISGVSVEGEPRILNGDGLHITCCRNVIISDCDIVAGDDAIPIFTFPHWLDPERSVSENFVISNCLLSSDHSGLRFGYTNDGVIQNIRCCNVIVRHAFTGIDIISFVTDTWESFPRKNKILRGPLIQNLSFSNFSIDAAWGITANLYENAKLPAGIKDLTFTDFTIRCTCGNYFLGSEGKPVRNIRIDGMTVFPVGERTANDGTIPNPARPSKPKGLQISHAFAFRQVAGVVLNRLRVDWERASGFWRSSVYFENAQDVAVDGLLVTDDPKVSAAALSMRNCERVHIFNSPFSDATEVVAEIAGEGSKRIPFLNCEWERIRVKIRYIDGASSESAGHTTLL
jgi:hypothetical protein